MRATSEWQNRLSTLSYLPSGVEAPRVRSWLHAGAPGPRNAKESTMRRFLIEREIPGVGKMDDKGLRDAARQSNAALAKLGPDIQWVESYVVADKTYCVYLAKDEQAIREHAKLSGFPASKISEIKTKIDPATAG
jgi:hypothetical protein